MKKKLLALFLSTILIATATAKSDSKSNTTTKNSGLALSFNAKDFNEKTPKVTICGAKVSPYVFINMVMLNALGVKYEVKEVLPVSLLKKTNQPIPAEFEKISVFGKIPAYQEQDIDGKEFNISDSLAIAAYFEKKIADNVLYPRCPKAYARVAFFSLYAYNTLAPLTHAILVQEVVMPQVLKQEKDEKVIQESKEALKNVFDFLEKTLSDDRTYIADTKNMSMADIAIVGHMVSLIKSNLNLLDMIGSERPYLQKYVNRVLSSKAFVDALK